MSNVIDRMSKPTPRFFQKLRNIGLILAAISTTIVASPVVLPAVLVKVAGYMAVAGSVMGGVSQATVTDDDE